MTNSSAVRPKTDDKKSIHMKWERLIRGWLMLPKNFESLDLSMKLSLMKPLFYQENFAEVLTANRKWIFEKILRYQDLFLLSCSSVQEMPIVLKNIILCCRMFQPDHQKVLFNNLERLLHYASKKAKKEGNISIDFDGLLSNLVDFNLLPITYSKFAKTVDDHRFIFSKTVWKQLPLIASLTRKYVTSYESFAARFESILSTLKLPKIVKAIRWKFSSEEEIRDFKMLADAIYKIPDSNRGLSLLIYASCAVESNDENFSDAVFQVIVKAFKDQTKCDRETESLISSVFANLPEDVWKPSHIKCARQIKKVSLIQKPDVLLAAYNALRYSDLTEDWHDDVLQGFQESPRSWMKILYGLINDTTPCGPFYTPVKSVMKSWTRFSMNGRQYYADMCEIFSSILLSRESATPEDWDLLFNPMVDDYFSNYLYINLVLGLPVLDMSESNICCVTEILLFDHYSDAPLVLALIRVAEISKKPEETAMMALELINNIHGAERDSRKSVQLLKYVYVLANLAQTKKVHRQSLIFVSRVLKKWLKRERKDTILDSDAILNLIKLLIKHRLCQSEYSKKLFDSIFDQVKQGLFDSSFPSEDHLNLILVLFEVDAPRVLASNLPENDSFRIGYLCYMNSKRCLNEMEISESLRLSRELVTKSNWDVENSLVKAKMLSQILLMANSILDHEVYLYQLLPLLLEKIPTEDSIRTILRPRLMLSDAQRSKTSNSAIPSDLRNSLLSFESWHQLPKDTSNDDVLAYYLMIQNERQAILEAVARILGDGQLDEKLISFVLSLYFLRLDEAWLSEKFTVSILALLAK
jgi:hypothetical protein